MSLHRGAVVCLAVGAMVLSAGVAEAVQCVEPSGAGGCHITIQAALNAAAPGETVNVLSGTYVERLTIFQSVVLLGAQSGVDPTPGGARLNPSVEAVVDFTSLPRANPNVEIQINSGVSDVTIDGFTLIGQPNELVSDESIIRVGGPSSPTNNNNITIANNIMDGWKPVLYKGGGSTNFDLVTNRMTANKNGMVVQFGVNDITVSGNVFTMGGAAAGDAAAMYATAVQGGLVENNIASGWAGRGWGGSGHNDLEIRGNQLNANNDAISIWGDSSNITIAENEINDNLRYGINLKAADVLIELNEVMNNLDSGINIDFHVNATVNNTVRCNDIAGNTNYGLKVGTAVTATVLAEGNWWGDATGPDGSGDAVTGLADYDPWLLESSKTAAECLPPQLPASSAWVLALLAVLFIGLLALRRSRATA